MAKMQEASDSQDSSHQITWYLQLKSKNHREQLEVFKYSHILRWTMWVFASATTVAFVSYWITVLVHDAQDLFEFLLCIFTFVFAILPMWCATILRNRNEPQATRTTRHVQTYLESFVALSLVISTALVIVMRLVNGLCSPFPSSYFAFFICTPNGLYHHLPYDTVAVLLFLPPLCSLAFACILWEIVIAANIIAIITVIATVIVTKASFLLASLCFIILFLFVLQCTYRLHTWSCFCINRDINQWQR